MDNNSAVLTVIIPITKIENKKDFVKFNLDIAKRCNFKVILVHDIQDSRSSKILNKLVEECEHWTLIEGKFGNAAKARNEALKIAETEWITFWDSDDKVRGNNFLYLLNQTIKENSDVGIGNFDITDFNQEPRISKNRLKKMQKNIISHPGIWRYIFRRKFVENKEFRNLSMGEDVVYLCEIFGKNPKITTVNNSIYSYSVNFPGQTTAVFKNYAENLKILSAIRELLYDKNLKNKNLIFRIFFRQCLSLLKRAEIKIKFQVVLQLFSILNYLINSKEHNLIANALRPPTTISILPKAVNLNTVYLHGGLGNQLFQITELLERFPLGHFQTASTNDNIFDKYNLLCPIDSVIVSNTTFNKKLSKPGYVKGINILLRLNYLIQGNNKVISFLARLLEKAYIPLLELSLFQGYSLVTDHHLMSKSFYKQDKPFFFIGYFQFSKDHISTPTLDYLRNLLDPSYFKSNGFNLGFGKKDLPLVIHVRLGDYRGLSNFDTVNFDYFSNALDYMVKKKGFNAIWVFSNEPSSAINFLPDFIKQHPKLTRSDYANEFYDFQSMRFGVSYIISNSTFSWWAAILSFTQNPTVIAPKSWFKMQKQPYKLIPSNWILI